MFKVEVGKSYLFFGVLTSYIGRVKEVWMGGCLLEKDCSWIKSVGDSFTEAFRSGKLQETQLLGVEWQVGFSALSGLCEWKHKLPTT